MRNLFVNSKVWTKIEYILWRIVWKFNSKIVNLLLNYDENQLKLRQFQVPMMN